MMGTRAYQERMFYNFSLSERVPQDHFLRKVAKVTVMNITRPLWTCPRCKKKFVTRNLWHSCGNFTVVQFLKGKSPQVKRLFKVFVALVKKCGPVIINPSKTRVSFQARMRFAGVSRISNDGLTVGFILTRRLENPIIAKIEAYSPRSHGHYLRIKEMKDLDDELLSWLKEAYKVGKQEHLH